MATTITRAARDALSAATTDGNRLLLAGQLSPRAYSEVKRVLEAAGGRWDRRIGVHLFPGDAGEALAAILAGDRVTSAAEADQWYPTPSAVVARLLDLAGLEAGHEVLEPSAGLGAIAWPAVRAGCLADCVEIDPRRAAALKESGLARMVTCADFLTVPPAAVYDRVLMNPPFAWRADTRHVLHALRFVRPGGRLVSVMSASVSYRSDKDAARVRELASAPGGAVVPLPAGSFTEAGAGVSTVLVVIPVPVPPSPAEDEPRRVRFDRTARPDVPLFHPGTAGPGVYVHYDAWTGQDQVFRFAGNCLGCGVRTWAHAHGGDDVRGPFGDHTCVPLDAEDLEGRGVNVPEGTTFPRCALCWNERDRYERAIARALEQLRNAQKSPETLF